MVSLAGFPFFIVTVFVAGLADNPKSGFVLSDFILVHGAKGCRGEMGDRIASFGDTGVVAVVPTGAIVADDDNGIVALVAEVDIATDFLLSFLGPSSFSTTATVMEVVAGAAGDPSFFLCFFFFLAPFDFPSLHKTCTKSEKEEASKGTH